MSKDIVSTVFIELAVQRGLRSPDGTWKDDSPAALRKALRNAFEMTAQAESASKAKPEGE